MPHAVCVLLYLVHSDARPPTANRMSSEISPRRWIPLTTPCHELSPAGDMTAILWRSTGGTSAESARSKFEMRA